MKKLLFVLLILGNVVAYSNSKCEVTARKGVELLVQTMKDAGLKTKYNYLGVSQGNQNFYMYEIVGSLDGTDNKVLVAIDVANGGIYLATDYTSEGLKKGQRVDFQPAGTGIEHLKCK